MTKNRRTNNTSGFTIIELLVVIVVIGILAAITTVGFNGVRARAIEASLKADVKNASQKLEIYQAENGQYPTSLADVGYEYQEDIDAFKASNDAILHYYAVEDGSVNGCSIYYNDDNSSPCNPGPAYCINVISLPTETIFSTSSLSHTPQEGQCWMNVL